MEYFTEFGYAGLFIAAFLAATILPLSSEVVLSALTLAGLNPVSLVLVATTGNVLGSLLNYALGYWLSIELVKKWLKISEQEYIKAEQRFEKYGLFSLLFAWVPIIGDPLTLIAGVMRIRLTWFVILVSIGKLGRYSLISYLLLQNP
jgi:membrane protein YqaA with SNARE-associated domain